jgi:hypothetical protein
VKTSKYYVNFQDTTGFSRVVLQLSPRINPLNHSDTTGFSRVVPQFSPSNNTLNHSDTTGFSRVVLQLWPQAASTFVQYLEELTG